MDAEVARVDWLEWGESDELLLGIVDRVAIHAVSNSLDIGGRIDAFPTSVGRLCDGGVLHGVGMDVVDAGEDLFADAGEDTVEAAGRCQYRDGL